MEQYSIRPVVWKKEEEKKPQKSAGYLRKCDKNTLWKSPKNQK